jgi:hypothetical protein
MFEPAREKILETLDDDDVVLDIGGWAKPFTRADWMLDVEPYETRAGWGYEGDPDAERYSADTWVVRDICDHEPWPFADGQFDFITCAQTLEDIRDPIWVCSEIARVGKAGYIEVPSRLVEQTWGVQGDWVGYGHHHWLIDISQQHSDIRFVFKPHVLVRGDVPCAFPASAKDSFSAEEEISALWWEGSFSFHEDLIFDPEEHHRYLMEPLEARPELVEESRRSRWGKRSR